MIAKSSVRVADGTFANLSAYITNDKRIGDLRDWQRTGEYILDVKGDGARVAAIRVTHCRNREPALAIAEIAALQARNTTSKADKTYHLIVSFPPGEKPSPERLVDIEDYLCWSIGLVDHQRISAVHNDTDHFHFHVAINKVHPATLRVVTPYFDKLRLQSACAALEKRHRLTPTPHPTLDRDGPRLRERETAMELHGPQQSLLHWVREVAGVDLLHAQEHGGGWQDLHRAAARYGLEIRERGAGLTLAVKGDRRARVKPSDVDRRLSFGGLTASWGPFEPAPKRTSAPERVYPSVRMPAATLSSDHMYERYKADCELVATARLRIKGNALPTWPQWLVDQAEKGDQAALALLRRAKERKEAVNAAVLSSSNLEDAKHILYQHLKPTIRRDGAIVYSISNEGGRVIDFGSYIRVDGPTNASVVLALTLAADKFGARPLQVDGSDAFKALVVEHAGRLQLPIRFTDAGLEAARQERALAQQQAVADVSPIPPQIAAYILQRNETAKRVPGINPHRRLMKQDQGETIYAGRRNLGNNIPILLLRRGDDVMVKAATLGEYTLAARWRVGDMVKLDELGRLIGHAPAARRDTPAAEAPRQSITRGRGVSR